MSYPNPRLCRVSLRADTATVDLALPAGVPIVELLPAVVDILAIGADGWRIDRPAAPYRLARPGAGTLDSSKTLAQHAIRDGTVLLLTRALDELPVPRFHDPAEQVSAAAQAMTRPWTSAAARCTAGVTATGLAAVAGFVAVPGGPGAPNVLLAAVAAATAAVLAMHLGETGPTLTALCCVTVLAAAAALAGVLSAISLHGIGALAAAASIGLLHAATRLSIALAGLTQRAGLAPAGLDDRTVRAHHLLTGLVAGLSTAATLGALGAVAGVHTGHSPRFGGIAVAGVIGAALLLRARSHTDRTQIAALLIGGSTAIGGSLAAAAASVPHYALGLAAAAAAAAGAALYLGGRPVSPLATCRAVELLEYAVLTALAPLTCWICGCYGTVRGLSL